MSYAYFLLKPQFPIGIDSDRFERAIQLPQVKNHIKEFEGRFGGRKVRKKNLF